MLVLQVDIDERIMIGSNIRVMLVRRAGDSKVRLGIEAPPDVPVDRESVYLDKVRAGTLRSQTG